ncbi:MAG: capsid protein [Wigfec virus K19_227]|nr:MAG: capsid protein [Wigfec virus K19_227]
MSVAKPIPYHVWTTLSPSQKAGVKANISPKRTHYAKPQIYASKQVYAKRAKYAKTPYPSHAVKPKAVSRPKKLHGYGDYSEKKSKKKDEDLSFSSAGGKVGKWIGTKLGHMLGQITGFGDYEVKGNSIMDGGMTPPQIVNSVENGAVIVRHREYIGDIASTIAFNLTAYPINPGMSSTFPWLAQMAQSFEQYEMRGCIFEFVSTSSDSVLSSGTSTALGSVMLATEYDSLESTFSGKREMLNHEFANSTKPSVNIIHPIECKRDRTPVSQLYIRSEDVPTGGDKRLYDLGNFQLATEGMQAAAGTLGELWVSYECAFYKQKFDPIVTSDGLTDHFQLTGVTNTLIFGTGVNPVVSSTLGGTIQSATRRYYWDPAIYSGKYLFCWYVQGTSTPALATPNLSAAVNCVALNYWNNDTTQVVGSPNGLTSSNMMKMWVYEVTAPAAYIEFGAGTLPTSVTSGDLWVTQISQNIVTDENTAVSECCDEFTEETSDYVKQLEVELQRLRAEKKSLAKPTQ